MYTDCGSSLRLCTTVSIEINITNFRKIFHYGVKIYHYEKLVGIRELSELFALDCLNNPFSTDTGTPEKNIPPLYEVDDIATFYTCRALYFSSYYSFSTEVRTISDITLKSAPSSASNLVDSVILDIIILMKKKYLGWEGSITGLLEVTHWEVV